MLRDEESCQNNVDLEYMVKGVYIYVIEMSAAQSFCAKRYGIFLWGPASAKRLCWL